MPITLDLPPGLEEDLTQEAESEGIPLNEHAALLVSILTALLRDTAETPFQAAIRNVIAEQSLDPSQVARALGELVERCVATHDPGKTTAALQDVLKQSNSNPIHVALSAWRSFEVHQPGTESFERVIAQLSPHSEVVQQAGRLRRAPRGMGKYAHVPGSSEDFSRRKQEEIAREDQAR